MADLEIPIAGRMYRVACEDGQEDNLARAGRFVAEEAELLRSQFGDRFSGLSESRVLLMASLMLGDRFRAKMDEEAAAPDGAGPAGAASGAGGAEDPAASARMAELEAELAEAREAEAAALAALEDAAARVRAMAGEIAAGPEDEDEDEEAGEDEEV